MPVLVQYSVNPSPVARRDLTSLTRTVIGEAMKTLPQCLPADPEVSVLYTGDLEIHSLNKQYRGIDKPTDVLSFALHEGGADPLAGELLGDIVISLDTASRQARSTGRTLRQEIAHLLVHGLLHLAGFDHDAEKGGQGRERTKAMRKAEEKCLEHLAEKLVI